jgi:hypothetical protein
VSCCPPHERLESWVKSLANLWDELEGGQVVERLRKLLRAARCPHSTDDDDEAGACALGEEKCAWCDEWWKLMADWVDAQADPPKSEWHHAASVVTKGPPRVTLVDGQEIKRSKASPPEKDGYFFCGPAGPENDWQRAITQADAAIAKASPPDGEEVGRGD